MRRGTGAVLMLGGVLCAPAVASRRASETRSPEAVYYANAYADHFGLPRELIHAVISHESGWNRLALAYTAVAGQGRAVGLMQLMPATSAYFAVQDPTSIRDNIRGGATYLAVLYRQFHGDLRLVLAAYYCGSKHIADSGLRYHNAEVVKFVTEMQNLYEGELALHRTSSLEGTHP